MTIAKQNTSFINGKYTETPYELSIEIVSYLPDKEIARTAIFSKEWKKLSESEEMWRRHVPYLPFYKDRFNLKRNITTHEPDLLKKKYKGEIFISTPQSKNETPEGFKQRIIKSVAVFAGKVGVGQSGVYTCFSCSDLSEMARIAFSHGNQMNTVDLKHLQSTTTVNQYLKENDVEELHIIMGPAMLGPKKNKTDRVNRAPRDSIVPFIVPKPKEAEFRIQNSFPTPTNGFDIQEGLNSVLTNRAVELYKKDDYLRNQQTLLVNYTFGFFCTALF